MAAYLRNTVLKGWHLRRYMGLGAGLFLAYQAIAAFDGLTGLLSGVFLLQAITNTGCFGKTGCGIPYIENSQKNESFETADIEYEEIK